ncbi:putative RFA2-DNA replication factor A, 36 kDa subunit-like protein [Gregarina niphandrodes]|uniref:RFA2-DNA replication factor A, 36 kDa subunit-like protein n=1 Tax=Gregarina niphandrodes TaxID=110365 RepID=A0A023B4W9_GRENI|nr:putative RFA2-DNA replication factor A, 36 kDa subunit-like protein [Gregarina niphandrodes]EZG57850.1 putative RFA2-DNA replication factor A, 36 kDa subunit-like protein [Gregarina niphandrodes]|eukprot:XP_011131016.1 putative RFA2-DNA replication factor A, 36 kDa subunit-like protein [Gregarina niphandrodes]
MLGAADNGWAQSFGFAFEQNIANGSSVNSLYSPFSTGNEKNVCRSLMIGQYLRSRRSEDNRLVIDGLEIPTFSIVGIASEAEVVVDEGGASRFVFKVEDGTGQVTVEWVRGLADSEYVQSKGLKFVQALQQENLYVKCFIESYQIKSELKAVHCKIVESYHDVLRHIQDVALTHLRTTKQTTH